MIRDPEARHRREVRRQRRILADLEADLRLFQTLMDHACALGVRFPQNPLEGVEPHKTVVGLQGIRSNRNERRGPQGNTEKADHNLCKLCVSLRLCGERIPHQTV